MTKQIIPDGWVLGVEEIDKEHQNLFQLFDKIPDEHQGDWADYDIFFERLLQLMDRKKEIFTVSDEKLTQYKFKTEAALSALITLRDQNSPTLMDACLQALLLEVVRADLYYNHYQQFESRSRE